LDLISNMGTFVIIGLFSLTILPVHTLISASDNLNRTETYRIDNATDRNNILTLQILANNLQNRLVDAAAIMEITGNLSEIRSMPNASLLNSTLEIFHGIPPDSDLQKRRIAQDIISNYPDITGIAFIMPNGDTHFLEPNSLQSNQTKNNLAYRDYFKCAIATNDTYLGDIITSTASGLKRAMIAVPVHSQTSEGDLTGIWVGSIDLGILNKELQSLNLTEGQRIVYVDSNDTKIADSDKKLSNNSSESFSNLKSFQNAIDGDFGSIVEEVNREKKSVSYYPVEALQNRWVVLWMQPVGSGTANVVPETGGKQEASNITSTISTINNTSSSNAVLGTLFLAGEDRLTSFNQINATYTVISYVGNRTIIPTEGVTTAITNATEIGNLTLKLQSNGITFVEGQSVLVTKGRVGDNSGNAVQQENATAMLVDLNGVRPDDPRSSTGVAFFSTNSTGQLAFLDKMIAIYQVKATPEGTAIRMWEWKGADLLFGNEADGVAANHAITTIPDTL
jgi:hypothetical protein